MEFKFKTKPFEHQITAFIAFKDSEYSGLFADMGTGKTKVAIDIAAYRFLNKQINAMLIIAPNNVHVQWISEQFPTHCPIPYRPFIWKSAKIHTAIYKDQLKDFLVTEMEFLKVLSVNVEAFQSDGVIPYIAEYVKHHNVFTVVDEATRIKHSTAKRTETIIKLNKYGSRMIITGTPTAKSPFDLWAQMEFLKANYFGCTFFVFQHRYGIVMLGKNPKTGKKYHTLIDEKTYNIVRYKLKQMTVARGKAGLMPNDYETISVEHGISEKDVYYIEAHEEYTQFKRLDELKAFIQKDVFMIKKEDCLDLPPKVYECMYVDLSKEQRTIYDNLCREMEAEYEGTTLTLQNKISLTTRLMQVAGGFFPYVKEADRMRDGEHYTEFVAASKMIGKTNPKIEALKDDIEESDKDTKIIVWAHFVSELKAIYDVLRSLYPCCLYYGGTSQHARTEIITDFQHGRYKIFIGNAATAGFGLNLQNATLQYYFSNTFRTEDRLQAEDRSHRIGVKSTCVYKDIIAKDTIDEGIYRNIATGKSLNDYFKTATLHELLHGEKK